MGFFSSLFKQQIICPLCKQKIDIKKAKESGEIELLGKDVRGYIHIKHKGVCGAHIVWSTLTGKTHEQDIPEKYL